MSVKMVSSIVWVLAHAPGLRKAYCKDVREHQQQVIEGYCRVLLLLEDRGFLGQKKKKMTECTSKMTSLRDDMTNLHAKVERS